MFNTLKYAKILEEVGFSREQAETSVKILVEIMEDRLASKQDIKDLARDIQQVEDKLGHSISQAKSELTVRMGAMIAASVALLTALNKLI